jgi:ribosomal protein L37AE/L43A
MSGLVDATGKPLVREAPKPCPACGADASRRINAGGFGPLKVTLCGACGHEFRGDA